MEQKLYFYRLVPELLGYAIWAYMLYRGFWLIGRWTSNAVIWAPAFAIIVAPFLALASLRPPQPITVRVIGGLSLLLFGFGFLIWPALNGVRGAAQARISPLLVLVVSFVAYLIGVGSLLGYFALAQPNGLDMAVLFAPIWLGGPAIWGGLRLVAALIERRKTPPEDRHTLEAHSEGRVCCSPDRRPSEAWAIRNIFVNGGVPRAKSLTQC